MHVQHRPFFKQGAGSAALLNLPCPTLDVHRGWRAIRQHTAKVITLYTSLSKAWEPAPRGTLSASVLGQAALHPQVMQMKAEDKFKKQGG